MSTSVLLRSSVLEEVPHVNGDTDDVQCDSLRLDNNRPSIDGIRDLHQCLIDIDEEVGDEELEGLKFLCRDHISVSKLDKAQTSLEIFDIMKKMVLIDSINVDFLLECLGRVHRFDLVRKLGFQPDGVRDHLHEFKKLYPFRTLLMDITEDLDDQETEKIRFFLRGKIRKKQLNERRSLLQLFVFMEQEGLLAHNRLDLLTRTMESIRRGDLVDRIREYQGLRPLQRHEPGLDRNTNPTVPSHHEPYRTPNSGSSGIPSEASRQREGFAQSSSASDLARSISAGTISVNSEENEAPDRRVIPQHILDQIVTDLAPQVDDLGFELGLTNLELGQYQQQIPDTKDRALKIIQHWQRNTVDKGTISSGLYFTLTKLGCKKSAEDLKRWTDSFDTEQAAGRSPSDFVPSGPPQPQENHCASLREAQMGLIRSQVEQAQLAERAQHLSQLGQMTEAQMEQIRSQLEQAQLAEHAQNLSQLHITANQIPHQTEVNFVNDNIALYQLGGQFVANAGVSRELTPMPVTVNNIVQGQVQQGQGQQVPPVATGNTTQVIVPVVQRQSEQIPALPAYPMNNRPRGWCVIINNREFHVIQGDNSSKEMPARNGTDKDAESLQHIFSKLGFIVRRRDNLSDTEMMNFLIDVSHNVDHKNFDCFVCCILTHGVINNVYGSNGKLVSIKDLTATFQTNRCESLAGKPKLFFLQACQGRDKMTGGSELERDMPTKAIEEDGGRDMIPNEADFLLGYATVPGYVSFRSRNHGSWYIRKLCELLDKYASRFDLMSILVEVNREVAGANAAMDGGLYKQIPAPLVTLRKQLYFK